VPDVLPDGYHLRPPTLDDAEAVAAAYVRNRDHLAPWDPTRPERFYTAEGQREDLEMRLEAQERGLFDSFLIVTDDDDIAGRANIQNIVRGTMMGGTLGYWVDRGHLQRGVAKGAVEELVERARATGLHRLEAGTMVENVASQRVLEVTGFERYGVAPKLLYLNGAWRDHVLFQRILHDDPLPG
jgi:[ribosomal protein S5]-alanine N-acetyltransferase